jgi:hypothetical protein
MVIKSIIPCLQGPALAPIPSQMNPVNILTPHFFKISFNVIFPIKWCLCYAYIILYYIIVITYVKYITGNTSGFENV